LGREILIGVVVRVRKSFGGVTRRLSLPRELEGSIVLDGVIEG
jgi:hypothetical protein